MNAGYGLLNSYLSSNRSDIVELSVKGTHTFFGYYDKTPFSADGALILGMAQCPEDRKSAYVGCFDLSRNGRFERFGSTSTWSWQLGSRLQWLPKRENEIIGYNKAVGGRCGFVLQNIKTGKIEAEYDDPVFDVSPDGKHALSINFARLHRMRAGYGYGEFEDPGARSSCPDDDGIVSLDLEAGTRRLLISLHALCALCPCPSMVEAVHYVNHVSFAPFGRRFMFLHLWKGRMGSRSRPITCDVDGQNPCVLEREINMSHYAWKSDAELVIHTSKLSGTTSFRLYQDQTTNMRPIGEGILTEPGHPSFSPDGRFLIVDTYPDAKRRQKLLLCTSEGDLVEEIGPFYSPMKFSGDQKCDLHPRWDRSGTRICFDSAHNGRRAMYIARPKSLRPA
jgi:hypothetical protein